jgi:hypothetical protein
MLIKILIPNRGSQILVWELQEAFNPARHNIVQIQSCILSHENFRCKGAIVAMRQLPRGFFLKNECHFKDIFRDFEAFLKIFFLFKNIFREIEVVFVLM